jgi:hypothetical protein
MQLSYTGNRAFAEAGLFGYVGDTTYRAKKRPLGCNTSREPLRHFWNAAHCALTHPELLIASRAARQVYTYCCQYELSFEVLFEVRDRIKALRTRGQVR